MTQEEILSRLCYYDLRNPNGVNDMLDFSPEIYEDEDFGEHAKENCSCDNCFYGRTQLAEYILKILSIDSAKGS
jgi:hypothetical protein